MFSDMDLEKLKLVRNEGSVTNLKDRRTDIYELNTLQTGQNDKNS